MASFNAPNQTSGYGATGRVSDPFQGGGGAASGAATSAIDAILGNGNLNPDGTIKGTLGVRPGGPAPRAAAAAPAAGAGSSSASGSAGTFTNTTAPNPVSNTAIDEIMKRYQDKSAAGLDDSIRKLRANASMGIAGEMAANRARMGSSGTSQDSVDARALAQGQEHNINSLTTDFVLGREKEKDNLIQAYGNMGLAQGNQQQAGAAQAFNQWATQQNLELQKKNDYLRSLQVVSSLLDSPSSGIL